MKRFFKIAVFFAAAFAVTVVVFWKIFLTVPKNFPSGAVVKIEKGLNLGSAVKKLKDASIVKKSWPLSFLLKISGMAGRVKYGDYLFKEPVSVFGAARKIIKGDFGVKPVKILIPEGVPSKNMAEIFKNFENFNADNFLIEAKNREGYLFPDTYLFLPWLDEKEIIAEMTENFSKKAGTPSRDTVIMASLIEEESPPGADRRIISGILWKRIKIGMPLQIDAVFPFINGNNDKILLDDLKKESPYNTYLNKGLPPGPISNPGLDAIDAALNPKDSSYLYYLHGKNGKTYFAKTYDEHLKNKVKYLK